MSFKWVTINEKRSYKLSEYSGTHYVYDGSGSSIGSASSKEDAISIIKSHYGDDVWKVEIGGEQSGCFPASTRVLTPSGWRYISAMVAGDQIVSFKCSSLTPRIQTVTKRLDHGIARLWELRTTAGSVPIRSTANHSYLTTRGWIQLQNLEAGDDLVGLNLDGSIKSKVISTSETSLFEPVFNLHTTGDHNFVAEGYIVHNFTRLRQLRVLWHTLFVDSLTIAYCPQAVIYP